MWWVDIGNFGELGCRWFATDKSFRMLASRVIEYPLAFGRPSRCQAGMNVGRGQQCDPGVMVLVVVPGNELRAEISAVFQTLKVGRVLRPVLERLKERFDVGVVVGRARPRMGWSDPEVGKELIERLSIP
jgi:hypothetical protein